MRWPACRCASTYSVSAKTLTGEVTPKAENCSTPEDEDCDGQTPLCPAVWDKRFGDAVGQFAWGLAVVSTLWLGLLVNSFGVLVPLVDAVWGAALGYLSLWSVYWAFRLLTGKEGMGFGDFKLLAALGAWLGWQALPLVIILSSLVGAVIGVVLIVALGRDRNVPIPFGPYLAAAGWITLLWGDAISGVYLSTVAP